MVMGTGRNFSANFKAKVALEALVGDQTLAEVAAKHDRANPLRQAKDRLLEVFAKKASDREAEVNALHAKIGQLTVEKDFCRKPSVVEPRSKGRDDRA